ncbi:putative nuclease activity [Lyophyllum shimeji]|uniref:Nuclease activity n=1 Tax=Lyophyllum shimeji TaxID=47721 RepID=A0A9P3PZ98_LYOSH|nr:putative nuclease activity [Lyophyllum shimeji]
MARSGGSNREMQERFQRSADTISKCFHRVLDLLVSPQFYSRYVKLPSEDHTPPEIQKNPIFYPFLKDCLGAIDGTHIDAATDSRIFKDAREHGLAIPLGKFYLADAGFPSCDTLLVPYRGVCYHLKEWGNATDKPRDYKELFNLRHSQARNAVERIFGIVKRRFTLINAAPEYSIHTQSQIILATCALHNFIRIYDPDDLETGAQSILEAEVHRQVPLQGPEYFGHHVSQAESNRATSFRDNVAKAMWAQYQDVLRQRS